MNIWPRLGAELDRVRTGGTGPGRMLVLRGRRQVGKSTLVEEFIRRSGVAAVFYTASMQTSERELALFGQAIADAGPSVSPVAAARPLGSWEAALTLLAGRATPEHPLLIVFDELPYLAASVPGIEAVLQKAWDRVLEKANVLLILIGSDLAMMEAMSEYGRPLYGRFREVVIPPLSPAEVSDMLGLDPPDALDAYLVIGGFPRLAALWSPGENLWQFLDRELSDVATSLAVLGERSISAEFPADLQARQVLEAIGAGERAYNAIGQRSGVPQTSLIRALETLQGKRVIRRSVPYSSRPNPRSRRYVVADAYLRFWLRFVNPNLELVSRGRGDVVLARIREGWQEYRGRAIEPIVRDAIERLLPDERFAGARFVGGYWTRDNQVEVDLVGGRGEHGSDVIDFVGSVKWKDRGQFDRDDFSRLVAHRERVPGATATTGLVGVSRTGFNVEGLDARLEPRDLVDAWSP